MKPRSVKLRCTDGHKLPLGPFELIVVPLIVGVTYSSDLDLEILWGPLIFGAHDRDRAKEQSMYSDSDLEPVADGLELPSGSLELTLGPLIVGVHA